MTSKGSLCFFKIIDSAPLSPHNRLILLDTVAVSDGICRSLCCLCVVTFISVQSSESEITGKWEGCEGKKVKVAVSVWMV